MKKFEEVRDPKKDRWYHTISARTIVFWAFVVFVIMVLLRLATSLKP